MAGRYRRGFHTAAAALLLACSTPLAAELETDPLDVIESLPVPYPQHWIFVHDAAFYHMFEGKMILMDPTAPDGPRQYKGMVNSSFTAPFALGRHRNELFVADLFYSRGWEGTRRDVISIYDQANLDRIAEIVMPFEKRAMLMPEKFAMQLIDNDRFLLVFNMNPATSVSVIDTERRQFVTEIEIPSCAMVYPTGRRGFTTLCADGSMQSIRLDQEGMLADRVRVEPFFDVGANPLFEEGTIIEGIGYFPTFGGEVQELDFRGAVARVGKRWQLASPEEQADNWRPGGHQLTASDPGQRFYVLMHPDGKEGSHKDGGPEVWVYDVDAGQRIKRIVLQHWGISIAVTGGQRPKMIVTNTDMNLDVYDARTGEFERTMRDFGQETPFVVYTMHEGRTP